MGIKTFEKDFAKRRKDYLIEKLTNDLKTLDIKELENINFIIEKRKRFVGFDAMGREIYNFPQPGPNFQFSSGDTIYPLNPYTMIP